MSSDSNTRETKMMFEENTFDGWSCKPADNYEVGDVITELQTGMPRHMMGAMLRVRVPLSVYLACPENEDTKGKFFELWRLTPEGVELRDEWLEEWRASQKGKA